MIELRRRMMEPEVYQYITIPDVAYIWTGVNARGTLKVEIEFSFNTISIAWVFGSRISATDGNFGILNQTVSNIKRFAYGANDGETSRAIMDYNRHIVVMDKGRGYLDGVLTTNIQEQDFEGIEMAVGTINANGSIATSTSLNVYYMKIWDCDMLIRDFIPAKRAGAAGLFDNVSGQFFGNSGGGVITAHKIQNL